MVIRVAVSAPGHQTRPQGTTPPKIVRPRATGRLYSIAISVWATDWVTLPCWLRGMSWARQMVTPAVALRTRRAVAAPIRRVRRAEGAPGGTTRTADMIMKALL